MKIVVLLRQFIIAATLLSIEMCQRPRGVGISAWSTQRGVAGCIKYVCKTDRWLCCRIYECLRLQCMSCWFLLQCLRCCTKSRIKDQLFIVSDSEHLPIPCQVDQESSWQTLFVHCHGSNAQFYASLYTPSRPTGHVSPLFRLTRVMHHEKTIAAFAGALKPWRI